MQGFQPNQAIVEPFNKKPGTTINKISFPDTFVLLCAGRNQSAMDAGLQTSICRNVVRYVPPGPTTGVACLWQPLAFDRAH